MKVNKQSLVRSSVTLWSFLLLAAFFQNCGQPGELGLQGSLQTQPDVGGLDNAAPDASPGTTVPDPVTLISNPSLVINDGQPFTKSANVMLRSGTIGAEEMMISNLPDCSSNNGWIPFSQQTAWILSAQNKDVAVYGKFRKKGAPESECIKASIVHDNIAPVVSFPLAAPKFTNMSSVQIAFNASDANGSGVKKIYCKPSNGAEAECVNYVAFTSLSENSYSVVIRAIDRAGNESAPLTDSFVVDRTAPVVAINGPTGIVAEGNPKFKISIVEINGVKQVSCRLLPLESNYKDCSSLSAEYSSLPSGNYKFEVVASDWAGNQGVGNHSYENDLSVPSVTITKAPLALGNIKDVSFEFSGTSGSKAITKFLCSLNGATAIPCASPFSYLGLTDKEHLFSVVGINAANVSSTPQSYKFIIDTTLPTISIVSAPSGRIKTQSVTIVLNASDLNGIKNIQCNLNGVISDCSSKTITYNALPDQNVSYTFYAVATDGAGNMKALEPISWVIDNTTDSKILASMRQNPVLQDEKGILDITLSEVYNPAYKCAKISDGAVVASGNIQLLTSAVSFTVSEDINCDVTGLDKLNQPMKVSVKAEVNCGNKIKENGKCVDFRCLSVVKIDYSKTLSIPARTTDGVCYAMKIFDRIAYSDANLTTSFDNDVVSNNHERGSSTRNPYSMAKDLLNITLAGPRVVKLSGGLSTTSPIKVDNFALIGLYPKAVQPTTDHYSAHGTADSVVDSNTMTILFKTKPVVLKPFGSSGTATIAPLDIVRVADPNLEYLLDIRALDCGSMRELSTVYVLFQ